MKPHAPTHPTNPPPQFDAEEWNRLTTQQRIRRCLLYAQEASAQAVHALPEAKQAYSDVAQHWLALAMEIERTTGTA